MIHISLATAAKRRQRSGLSPLRDFRCSDRAGWLAGKPAGNVLSSLRDWGTAQRLPSSDRKRRQDVLPAFLMSHLCWVTRKRCHAFFTRLRSSRWNTPLAHASGSELCKEPQLILAALGEVGGRLSGAKAWWMATAQGYRLRLRLGRPEVMRGHARQAGRHRYDGRARAAGCLVAACERTWLLRQRPRLRCRGGNRVGSRDEAAGR